MLKLCECLVGMCSQERYSVSDFVDNALIRGIVHHIPLQSRCEPVNHFQAYFRGISHSSPSSRLRFISRRSSHAFSMVPSFSKTRETITIIPIVGSNIVSLLSL